MSRPSAANTSAFGRASPHGEITGVAPPATYVPYEMLMSSCSRNVVAGSRMSAYSAESVRTWSNTTVKRSFRSKPRITAFWSGTVATGLQLYTNRPLTGGSIEPFSTAPSWDMLIVRDSHRRSPSTSFIRMRIAPLLLMV